MADLPDTGHHLEQGGLANRRIEENRRGAAGGARRGSGRPKQPRPWVRSESVRVLFRKTEWDAIDELAAVWDVPVATAVWALTVDAITQRTGQRARKLVQVSKREK